MNFKTYLQHSASQIEPALDSVLASWQKDIEKNQPMLTPLSKIFAEQCQGGKRLRGTLVKLGYELAEGKNYTAILQPAVALEIFQTAILAHDDIIDKSELRRGKPSLYQSLGGNHYGVSQTICLGDLGFFLSTELLATGDFPTEIKNQAVVLFTKIIQQTIRGEMIDILLPTQKSFTKNAIISLASLKTASYSISGPLTIGAVLAGANEKLLTQMRLFGENLGIAFQIQDDILGIFADKITLGKSNMSDIQEGKRTLLIWYAKQKANDSQKKILDTIYGKISVTKTDVAKIKEIFIQTGAYEYAVGEVLHYTQKARTYIPKLIEDSLKQNLLQDLTTFLLERKK